MPTHREGSVTRPREHRHRTTSGSHRRYLKQVGAWRGSFALPARPDPFEPGASAHDPSSVATRPCRCLTRTSNAETRTAEALPRYKRAPTPKASRLLNHRRTPTPRSRPPARSAAGSVIVRRSQCAAALAGCVSTGLGGTGEPALSRFRAVARSPTVSAGETRGGSRVGHEGLEPSANGLRIRCSTN